MPEEVGFDAVLTAVARRGRDSLDAGHRRRYELALAALLADPFPTNPLVTHAGDDLVLEYDDVQIYYEFLNRHVVRIFAVLVRSS